MFFTPARRRFMEGPSIPTVCLFLEFYVTADSLGQTFILVQA